MFRPTFQFSTPAPPTHFFFQIEYSCSLVVSFALMRFPRRRDPRDFDPFAREEDSFDSPSPRLFDIVEKREIKKTHTQNVSGRKENSSWIILYWLLDLF
jgi:hypothetical protein